MYSEAEGNGEYHITLQPFSVENVGLIGGKINKITLYDADFLSPDAQNMFYRNLAGVQDVFGDMSELMGTKDEAIELYKGDLNDSDEYMVHVVGLLLMKRNIHILRIFL